MLRKLIENNGSHYPGQPELNKTKILIATAADGEKYSKTKQYKGCEKRQTLQDWLPNTTSLCKLKKSTYASTRNVI